MAQVELGLAAHVVICPLDHMCVARDSRDEERRHLEPAFASVLAQGPAEGYWFDSSLEVCEPLALTQRLPVDGVLKPL